MECSVYITNITMSGIKNIDKEVSFDFYKKTLPKTFNLDKSNIKGIYGENGAGKSAVIHAVDIYKKLQLRKDYLSDATVKKNLASLINKATSRFEFSISFLVFQDQKILKHFTHTIVLQKKQETFSISKEIFYENLPRKIQGEQRVELLRIEEGVLIQKKLAISEELRLNTMNLLQDHSFISLYIDHIYVNKHKDLIYSEDIELFCVPIAFMVNTIHVYLNDSDYHDRVGDVLIKQLFENNEDSYEASLKKRDDSNIYRLMDSNADVIDLADKEMYLSTIAELTKFIKIFKPSLLDIEVEMKENQNSYFCEKYFKYKDYRIHVEFESTGIKKLVTLFEAFQFFVKGESVFIDEMDANIHDVYLMHLLEYFTYYAKGQLCFTTHNLGPMEVLRKQKFSIDFLSCEHIVTPWKKRGNYSVVNLYREGMIENSPFNIEPFDFAGVFQKES